MRIRFDLRCVLVLALLLSLSLCRAQTLVPPTVTLNFGTNTATQLWDLTGVYGANVTVNQKNGVQVPVSLGFTLVQDAAGNLHGVRNDLQGITLNDGAGLFGVNYTLSGKVTGSGGTAQAQFVVHFFGSGTVGGSQNVSFSAVLEVIASPSAEDGQLEGIAKFSAHLGGNLGGVNGMITDFAAPLPAGVDGTWTLNLQMLGGNSLKGTATITTDAGQTMGFNLSGPLNANNDPPAIARLRGSRTIQNTTISGVGSSVTISSDLAFDSGTLNGKVMGQKLQDISFSQ